MKTTVLILALLFALVVPAFAAQPKAEKKAPEFTTEQKEQFFKAQSALAAAQLAMERTREFQDHQQKAAAFQEIVNGMMRQCGADFQIALDKDGDPSCLPKPEPPKPAAKK